MLMRGMVMRLGMKDDREGRRSICKSTGLECGRSNFEEKFFHISVWLSVEYTYMVSVDSTEPGMILLAIRRDGGCRLLPRGVSIGNSFKKNQNKFMSRKRGLP
jgi:hypothetical protein